MHGETVLNTLARCLLRWDEPTGVCLCKRLVVQLTASHWVCLRPESEDETSFVHFLFWVRTSIFILSVCWLLALLVVQTCSFFVHIDSECVCVCVCLLVCLRRAGSPPVSVCRQRHSLLCDSAVDRGGSGRLLPSPLQTQQTQQGAQGKRFSTDKSCRQEKIMFMWCDFCCLVSKGLSFKQSHKASKKRNSVWSFRVKANKSSSLNLQHFVSFWWNAEKCLLWLKSTSSVFQKFWHLSLGKVWF